MKYAILLHRDAFRALIQMKSELFNEFKAYSEDFKVARYLVDSDQRTVKAVIEDGPEVYFNTTQGVKNQLDKLIIIKKEKLLDDFKNKSYIDVRYGESVYYR